MTRSARLDRVLTKQNGARTGLDERVPLFGATMIHRSPVRSLVTPLLLLSLVLTQPAAAAERKNGFDLSDTLVPAEEILWGGVRRDGIPPIHSPKFVAAADAENLDDDDRVIGVYRNDVAKAYPVQVMDRHEVVNDKFREERIVVTYCPLCFSGMAFTVDNDEVDLRFGVSGLLYNSDVLLWDYQTESLFSQIRSQAISGPLKGMRIPPIPTAHTTWRDWRNRHPDTLVLSHDTGFRINYRGKAYRDYYRTGQLMFPVARRSAEYRNKDIVLGIRLGGVDKAYPFPELRRHGKSSFNDSVGDRKLTIEWSENDDYARAVDADGNEVPTVIVFWFAWYAFHPQTEIFKADRS